MNESAMGDFLLKRRAALTPADVGLMDYGTRRVPSLRQEEVAILATMSVRRTEVLAWNQTRHRLVASHLEFDAPDTPAERPNMTRMRIRADAASVHGFRRCWFRPFRGPLQTGMHGYSWAGSSAPCSRR
jgi:hypothetical protein